MVLNQLTRLRTVYQTQAVIEFDNEGNILTANENFLKATGYRLDEIRGRHHRMFVSPEYAASQEYRQFWRDLAAGRVMEAEFQRFGKGGREVWIKASYCPAYNLFGRQTGVVKFAVDITATKLLARQAIIAAQQIARNSRSLAQVSQELGSHAGTTAAQAEEALGSSQTVRASTEAMARGADQMQTAIQEIARSSAEAARVTTQAVASANEGNARMRQLNESYAAIGKVVELISSIAQQTNLLALNATIEASRAGEAGKGFAVVADEVKQLAKRTDDATREIATRIQGLEADTAAATASISEVTRIIEQINGVAGTIAAAVEEQSLTTNEIGSSVRTAAEGTAHIAESLGQLAQAARSTASGAAETKATAAALEALAADLDRLS